MSDQYLQKYVGQSLGYVQQILENQGYKVHTVRIGNFSTGYIPPKVNQLERHIVISYDGNDPQQRVISVREY